MDGLTHSLVGFTSAKAGLERLSPYTTAPSILFAIERVIARWQKLAPKIKYHGLLVASLIAAVTHPLMDWTNNYGVRPLLPWDGRWFYGDLVFIVDPYIWLVLGGAMFL